jgi:hypothetical protein
VKSKKKKKKKLKDGVCFFTYIYYPLSLSLEYNYEVDLFSLCFLLQNKFYFCLCVSISFLCFEKVEMVVYANK